MYCAFISLKTNTISIASLCIQMTYHGYKIRIFLIRESHGSNVKQYIDGKLHFIQL